SKLPIDPINTTSSGNYYTYVTGGSFKLTSRFESQKQILRYVANDGGPDPSIYELGTDLNLAPFVGGLVGYWSFDEGSGTIAYDRSGYNNNGTLINGPTWQTETNCKVGKCLSFDGVDDYVEIPYNSSLDTPYEFSIIAWIFDDNCSQVHSINRDNEADLRIWIIRAENCSSGNFHVWNSSNQLRQLIPSNSWQQNSWFFFAGTAKVINNVINLKYYFNGQNVGQTTLNGNQIKTGNMPIRMSRQLLQNKYKKQIIDNVLFYNRAISDSEIRAIYEATK
ncbi:MAG: LamG domain-containing protein, partial [Patescibacteria group bacterium]|nr:LamG domain-containing protein [Patescibacteria group bacterium]